MSLTYAKSMPPWKSSSAIDPSAATMVVNSPRMSPGRSSCSQMSMTASEKSRCDQSNQNSWMGFAKLARFLNQREKEKAAAALTKRARCRRTHSLENEDLSVRKASSIDSLASSVEVRTTCLGSKEVKSIPASPSFPSRLERPGSDLQSSPNLHSKLSKSRIGFSRESMEYLVDGLPFTKAERKKLEKFSKINIHLHALFLAVEHQQLEKAHTILENVELDLSSLNSDNFNALDIALFTQNVPIAKLLLSYGAKENIQFEDNDLCANHLMDLIQDSEQKVDRLTTAALNTNVSSLSASQVKEHERQLTLWERRRKLLKRMQMGFEQLRPPDPPSRVTVHVVGSNELRVDIEEPDFQSSAIVTKYRVDWSLYEDFSVLAGTLDIYDLRPTEFTISSLQSGNRYYVRVAAGNVKGFSDLKLSHPVSAVPSIWRDVDGRVPRSAGKLSTMDDLFNQIRNCRPEYASEIKGIADQLDNTPTQQRKHQMKKSIRSLFTPTLKFHKHLKRGVFMGSILYNEDRVLVTTEEYLPIVEVDETYPSSLHTDFHWMMKVACTWDDVKSLRQDMDKSLSSSTVHFRSRLLQAAAQLQNAIGVQDLGQFFYKPLKDNNGTIVLSTVNLVRDLKTINAISMKWVPISKLRRKLAPADSDLNAGDILLASISEQIQYNQMSSIPLRRGLYLGYLKLKSTMDLIRVLVPEKTPNVPPHHKIRDNPHVSCEEWEWLKSLGRSRLSLDATNGDLEHIEDSPEQPEGDVDHDDGIDENFDEDDEAAEIRDEPTFEERDEVPVGSHRLQAQSFQSMVTLGGTSSCVNSNEVQLRFGRQLLTAAKHLFSILGVSKEDTFNHRVYDVEVIELSPDVAFILVLPSVENVCSVPGQSDEFASRHGFVALPVQIFEMVHMSTYQRDFISRYSRLSSILEMDTIMAHHARREAFSSSEVMSAKQRLSQLQDFQQQVDNTWKGMRWIMDVLTYARDKQTNGGVSLILLYDRFDSYSPMIDSMSSSRSRSHSPSPSPSLRSRRSADHVQFSRFKSGPSSSSYRCSLPSEKMQHLQVPINLSPTADERVWDTAGRANIRVGGIPKSYSDTFTGIMCDAMDASAIGDDDESARSMSCGGGGGASLASSLKSVSSNEGCGSVHSREDDFDDAIGPNCSPDDDHYLKPIGCRPIDEPGVLRVHAAYDTGLGGTNASIRLHVTSKTTSREVINLVVKQLNMAALMRRKTAVTPVTSDQLRHYCLVAVIGARERCLRDDFCPLKLQNPWTKGRLYVRMKNDVLAAIQHQQRLAGESSASAMSSVAASSDAFLSAITSSVTSSHQPASL